MAEERIIEFQTVKKGRTIMFIVLIAVFALASIGFMLLWILKPEGTTVGVTSIEMQSNLLKTQEDGKDVYVASVNIEYTVSATVEVIGDVDSLVKWTLSPSDKFKINEEKSGRDPVDKNKHNLVFTVKSDITDGQTAKIEARSSISNEVVKEYNFVLKAAYAAEANIVDVRSYGKSFAVDKTLPNEYDITLPYFASNLFTGAEMYNFYSIYLEQLGIMGSGGERAKLTRDVVGPFGKLVNTIEYSLLDVSEQDGVAAVIFDSTAGEGDKTAGPVTNKDDYVSVVFKKPGTARLKIVINKYNTAEELTYYLNITSKAATNYDTFLTSIAIPSQSKFEFFTNEYSETDFWDMSTLIVFTPSAPPSGTWNYDIYESDENGTPKALADQILTISKKTLVGPSSKVGRTYITVKDTSQNGYGISITKEVNVYAAITNLAFSVANADSKKTEIQKGDSINATASYTISNSAGTSLASRNLKPVLEFTYSAAEPVPVTGSTTSFSNAADTVIFDKMYFTGRYENSKRIFAIDPADTSRPDEQKIIIASGYKTATALLKGTVGISAPIDTIAVTFNTQGQNKKGEGIKTAIVSVKINETVTGIRIRTAAELAALGTLDEGDRFFECLDGGISRTCLVRPISGSVSKYSVLSLVEFLNSEGRAVTHGATPPQGVTVEGDIIAGSIRVINTDYNIATVTTEQTKYFAIKYTVGSITKEIRVYYKNTLKSFSLVNSAAEDLSYKPSSSGAVSASLNNSGEQIKQTMYNDTEKSTSVSAVSAYIFYDDTMLYKVQSGGSYYFYLNRDESTNTKNALFTMSSANVISITRDLFELSKNSLGGGNTRIYDQFEVVYTLFPLQQGADGMPEVIKDSNNMYYDITYAWLAAKGFLAKQTYNAIRLYDDIAFFNSDYTKLDLDENSTADSVKYSLGVNKGISFELFPSGIISYKDSEGVSRKVNVEQEKAALASLKIEPLADPAYTGNNNIRREENVAGYHYIADMGLDPVTYTMKLTSVAKTIDLMLKVHDASAPIRKIELYTNRSGSLGNYTFSDSNKVTDKTIIQLINNGTENSFELFVVVTYAVQNGLYTKYTGISTYFDTTTLYDLVKPDTTNPNRIFNLEITSNIANNLSIPNDKLTGGTALVIDNMTLKFTARGLNGSTKILVDSAYKNEGITPVTFLLDVTTPLESFQFKENKDSAATSSVDLLMTTAKEDETTTILTNATKTLTIDYIKDSSATSGAALDTRPEHLKAAGASITIWDDTPATPVQLRLGIDFSVTFDAVSGILTIQSREKCYEKARIDIKIDFALYGRDISKWNADGSPNVTTEAKNIPTVSINVSIKSEIYKIDFVSPAGINLVTSGSGGTVSGGFATVLNGGTAAQQLLSSTNVIYSVSDDGGIMGTTGKTYSQNYLDTSYDVASGNILTIKNDAPKPVRADGTAIAIYINAEWISSNGVSVKARLPVNISTIDVEIYFTSFPKPTYEYENGVVVVNYFSIDPMSFALTLVNKWEPSAAIDLSKYIQKFEFGTNVTGISFDSITPSTVIIGTGAGNALNFSVNATLEIKLGGDTSTRSHAIKAEVKLFNRVTAITTKGSNLPAQTGSDATGYDLTLVERFSFNVANYIKLLGTDGGVPWTQDFTLSVDTSTGKTNPADAGFVSTSGTYITVSEFTTAPSGTIYVLITAARSEGDTVAYVTKYIRLTLYKPTITASITNCGEAVSGVYKFNIIPSDSAMILDFSVNKNAINNIDESYRTIKVDGNSNKFTQSDKTTGTAYKYSIGANALTNADLSPTSVFSIEISVQIDGVTFIEVVKFRLIAELTSTELQNTMNLNLLNNGTVTPLRTFEVGVYSSPNDKLSAKIKDSAGIVANLIAKYPSAFVKYSIDVVDNKEDTVILNADTGAITLRNVATAFDVTAKFTLFGIEYVSESMRITITNSSVLETKFYAGARGSAFKTGTDINAQEVTTGSLAVDFDSTANQKVLYVVIDYADTNFKQETPSTLTFTPIVSGVMLSEYEISGAHEKGEFVDGDTKYFYAGYLISGAGNATIGGTISAYGLTYSSPTKNIAFTKYTLSDSDFTFPSASINLQPKISGDSSQTSHKSTAQSSIKAATFTSGFKGAYSVEFSVINGSINSNAFSNDFIDITFDAANGKFTATAKQYTNATTVFGGSVSINISITITSGASKGYTVSRIVAVNVQPYTKPVFTPTAPKEIEQDDTITSGSLFNSSHDSTDTGFAYKITSASKTSGVGTISSDTETGVVTYTAPSATATSVTIDVTITILSGYYKDCTFPITLSVHVLPKYSLTADKNEVTATEAVTLTTFAEAYINGTTNKPGITFIVDEVSGSGLGYVSSGTVSSLNYINKYVPNFNTAGGTVTIKACIAVNEEGIYKGRVFETNSITFKVLSLAMTNKAESNGASIASNVITIAPGGKLSSADYGIIKQGVTSAGANTLKAELVNGAFTVGKISMSGSSAPYILEAAQNANYTGSAITFENALKVTVVADGLTFINFFTIKITSKTEPAPMLGIYYKQVDFGVNDNIEYAVDMLLGANDNYYYDTSALFVGDSLYFYVDINESYPVQNVIIETNEPVGAVTYDSSKRIAEFKLTSLPSADLVFTKIAAIVYGDEYIFEDIDFKIKTKEYETGAFDYRSNTAEILNGGVMRLDIDNNISYERSYSKFGTIRIAYDLLLGGSSLINRVELWLDNITSGPIATSENGVINYTMGTNSAKEQSGKYYILVYAANSIGSGTEFIQSLDITVKYVLPLFDPFIQTFKRPLQFTVINDANVEEAVYTSSATEALFDDVVSLSTLSDYLTHFTVRYDITSGNSTYFSVSADGKLTMTAAGKALNVRTQVSVKATVTGGGKTFIVGIIDVGFNPNPGITSITKTGDEYLVDIPLATYGVTLTNITYKLTVESGNTSNGSFKFMTGADKNKITFERKLPQGGTYVLNITATIAKPSSVYDKLVLTKSAVITVEDATAPVLSVTPSASTTVNTGSISSTFTGPGGETNFEGQVTYAFVGESGIVDAGKGLITGLTNSNADVNVNTYSTNFTKNPTPMGGTQKIRVTVTLNGNTVNGIYANQSYSYDVVIGVEAAHIAITATPTGTGLGGTLSAKYVEAIYKDLAVTADFALNNAAESNILTVNNTAKTYTKNPTKDGGTVIVNASLSVTNTILGSQSFTASTGIYVEPLEFAISDTPKSNGRKGDIAINLGGIYSGETITDEAYKLSGNVTSNSFMSLSGNEYTKKPTVSGSTEKVTISFKVNSVAYTRDIYVYVEPLTISVTVNNGTAISGTFTASVNSTYSGTGETFAYSSTSNLLSVSSNAFTKKLSLEGGDAQISIVCTIGSDTFTAYTSVTVAAAVISSDITETDDDDGLTGTITASLSGIYSSVTPVITLKDGSTENKYITFDQLTGIYTKKPTVTGGIQTFTITFTYNNSVITKEVTVFVESAKTVLTAVPTGTSQTTGTFETKFDGIYSYYNSGLTTVSYTHVTATDSEFLAISNSTYTKQLTRFGKRVPVKSSVTYNSDTFTDVKEVVVEPVVIDASVTDNGLTGSVDATIAGIFEGEIDEEPTFTLMDKTTAEKFLTLEDDGTFTKIPTKTGATVTVKITYTLNESDYSAYVQIYVEPAIMAATVDRGTLTGNVTLEFLGIYADNSITVDSDNIEIFLSDDTKSNSFISLNGDSFTKQPTPSGSIETINVVYKHGASSDTEYTFTLQTTVTVEPAQINVVVTPNDAQGGRTGTIDVDYLGIYSEAETTQTPEFYLSNGTQENTYLTLTGNSYFKRPTANGSVEAVTVKIVIATGESEADALVFEKVFYIYVEPAANLQLTLVVDYEAKTITPTLTGEIFGETYEIDMAGVTVTYSYTFIGALTDFSDYVTVTVDNINGLLTFTPKFVESKVYQSLTVTAEVKVAVSEGEGAEVVTSYIHEQVQLEIAKTVMEFTSDKNEPVSPYSITSSLTADEGAIAAIYTYTVLSGSDYITITQNDGDGYFEFTKNPVASKQTVVIQATATVTAEGNLKDKTYSNYLVFEILPVTATITVDNTSRYLTLNFDGNDSAFDGATYTAYTDFSKLEVSTVLETLGSDKILRFYYLTVNAANVNVQIFITLSNGQLIVTNQQVVVITALGLPTLTITRNTTSTTIATISLPSNTTLISIANPTLGTVTTSGSQFGTNWATGTSNLVFTVQITTSASIYGTSARTITYTSGSAARPSSGSSVSPALVFTSISA